MSKPSHWLILIYERVEVTRFEDTEPRYMPGDLEAAAQVMPKLSNETEEEAAQRFLAGHGRPCYFSLVELETTRLDKLYVGDLDLVTMHHTSQGWSL